MRSYSRADRVAGEVKRHLVEILQKSIKDPRVSGALITSVKMTADLRLAKIYFVTGGGAEAREAAAAGFQSALGFLKRNLAARLGLRYMPDLKFYFDESFDYGDRIDQLLKSLNADTESNHRTAED